MFNSCMLARLRQPMRQIKNSVSITTFNRQQSTFKYSEINNEIDATLTKKLYPTHELLTPFQRLTLAAGSAIMSLTDPYRDDMVAAFGESTGHCALESIHRKMKVHSTGSRILLEKPRINSKTINLEGLSKLPSNTFGYAYYRFLVDNKVGPDTRKEVRYVDDAELAYVMQRYREIHDMIHTILGMPTNMLGEVLVKWVEAIQTNLPLCWLGGLFGAIKLNPKAKQIYLKEGLQWALKCGYQSENLMFIYYENHFEEDLLQLRSKLFIPPLLQIQFT